MLYVDAEVLVPAALQDAVTAENAGRVRAGTVVEIANGPVSFEAQRVLHERGVTVVPDILANAGGVTVSYFEWVQNREGLYWPLADVQHRLKRRMDAAFDEVLDAAERHGCDLRRAAYAVALGRIGRAVEAAGTASYFGQTGRV